MQGSGQRPRRLNPQDKAACKQFDRRMGGPHRWSGLHREYKDVLPLPTLELRFLGCPAPSLVVILNEITGHKGFFNAVGENFANDSPDSLYRGLYISSASSNLN
jgi:hypothetical protein